MRTWIGASLIIGVGLLHAQDETTSRLREAADVLREIQSVPDKGIPEEILENARCVAVFPHARSGSFRVGQGPGRGVLTCRDERRRWSAPLFVRIEGGSFGSTIGGAETDIVLVAQGESVARQFMDSKFTLGGDSNVMAGPVGRSSQAQQAQTDASTRPGILAYTRSRGLFAGMSLSGATVRADDAANASLYGSTNATDILTGKVEPPSDAKPLFEVLQQPPLPPIKK